MTGKLYGVGVGPGDPELVTLKALRLTKEADILAFPGENPRESVAYKIMKGAYPEIDTKQMISLPMPMTKDKEQLKQVHDEGTRIIADQLDQGKNVVFLTLGDPTVYSTYLYVHKRVAQMGYDTEIVSGITSFCAVSARFNQGLVEKAQQLHVIPASYQIEEALKLPGTKVLMKSGKAIGETAAALSRHGLAEASAMVADCGLPTQQVFETMTGLPEKISYFATVIVPDSKE